MKLLSVISLLFAFYSQNCLCFEKIFSKRINPTINLQKLHSTITKSILNEWIESQIVLKNLQNDNFQKLSFQFNEKDSKYSAIATKSIKKGEEVASIPLEYAITTSMIINKYKFLNKSMFKTGDYGLIAIYLIIELLSDPLFSFSTFSMKSKFLSNDSNLMTSSDPFVSSSTSSINSQTKSKYFDYIHHLNEPKGMFVWNSELQHEFYLSTTRDIRSQIEAANADYEMIINNNNILNKLLLNNKIYFNKRLFFYFLGIIKNQSFLIDSQLLLAPGSLICFHLFL